MSLINFEVNLIRTWSQKCVWTDMTTQAAVPAQGGNPEGPAINAPTSAIFKITVTTSRHFFNLRRQQIIAATKNRIKTNYQME